MSITNLQIENPDKPEEQPTIQSLPDGTYFMYDGDVYVVNRNDSIQAFSINGKYMLSRSYGTYKVKVFKNVKITLD